MSRMLVYEGAELKSSSHSATVAIVPASGRMVELSSSALMES